MHNIKFIRKEPDLFLKKIKQRNADLNLATFLDLDKKNRELIQKKEKLEQEKKSISKKKIKVNFQDQKKYLEKLKILKIHKKSLKIKLN